MAVVTGRAGLRRYELAAEVYDLVSLEWPLYGPPRRRAIDLLDPKPGAVVLDLACGTGLAFPALQSKIGPHGRIIGLDASTAMLTRARSRTERAGWRNVELVPAPAADFEAAIYAVGITATEIDAVLAAYALSVMDRWRDTWRALTAVLRAGTQVAIVDIGTPVDSGMLLAPLWSLLAHIGHSDPSRRTWELLDHHCERPRQEALRGGHVRVSVGTL